MNDIDFTGWEVPPGFTTFEMVERIEGPILHVDGTLTYGPLDHHYGVGHTAHLPHGGRLTVTPGDRNSYTAPGYYLAAYDAHDNWVWGMRCPNVRAALNVGRSQLRAAEYLYPTTRNQYGGEGVDGCLPSRAQIDQEEAGLLDLADPRRAYLHDSAEARQAQAEWMTATDAAPAGPRRPEVEQRGGVHHGPRPGPRR